MQGSKRSRLAVMAGAMLALAASGVAVAAPGSRIQDGGDWAPNAYAGAGSVLGRTTAQHGGVTQHIPPRRENIEVVSQLEMTQPFGDVLRGQIADVAVHKGFAYLMSWAPIDPVRQDCRGGVFVTDIRDPAKPSQVGFIPSQPGSYHGEGAHAISVDVPGGFKGDVLAVNNEACKSGGTGGFDLYDVSDPKNPKTLSLSVGDSSFDDGDPDTTGNLSGTNPPNSAHSVFLWQAGSKVYALLVDNIEQAQFGGHDVDIFDVTDPRNPKGVAEYNLYAWFAAQNIDIFPENTNGNNFFFHDGVVKKIGNRYVAMIAYWDAGYVLIDVTDPANIKYIGDTDNPPADPLTGIAPTEGNAHQGEFSFDNKFLLAADEDFAPWRALGLTITDGPGAGDYPASDVGGGRSIAALSDHRLNGQVVYGGYGCDRSEPIPPADSVAFDNSNESGAPEKIVVLQRGPAYDPNEDYDADGDTANDSDDACFPGDKAINAEEAGYDAVIIVNRHQADGSADGANEPYCGSGAFDPDQTIVTMCSSHEAAHRMFDDAPSYDVPADDEQELAPVGTVGRHVSATATFDGWGYAHLYKVGDGKGDVIGGKYEKTATNGDAATAEGLDPRFAFDFGDHSIHEFATDPTEYLAYSAYYASGLRVFRFGDGGLEETGAFVDKGGNDFWGVEQFTTPDGQRMIAASDRDYGLYLLRYTGPGAAAKPVCESRTVSAETAKPVTIALKCTDANGNPLALSIASQPANGSLSAIGASNDVTYTSKAGYHGGDSFTYRAFDGAAFSDPATITLAVGRCSSRIKASDAGDTIVGTVLGDAISGGGGNDKIEAAAGDDCVAGDAGNDQVELGDGDDEGTGGTGGDRLFGSAGKDSLRGNEGSDHIIGGSGNDRVRGDVGNDFLAGGSNNDVIVGGAGRDSIRGEAGNDRISAGSGNDAIDVGKGANRVDAGSGNDRVFAVNGRRDTIRCGAGRDSVRADAKDRVGRSCEVVKRPKTTRRK